jgi:pre-mRNA-processing factor 6
MARALQEVPSSGLLWSESIWHLEPRAQRKARSLEAIKKVENDPILFITVARIFWGERRLEKAMTWFEKAIVSNSDLGDAWAWYYKFLLQHGTDVWSYLPFSLAFSFLPNDGPSLTPVRPQEKRADVISKCILSEPKHGELWQSIAKDPANAYKSTEDILKVVADSLTQ